MGCCVFLYKARVHKHLSVLPDKLWSWSVWCISALLRCNQTTSSQGLQNVQLCRDGGDLSRSSSLKMRLYSSDLKIPPRLQTLWWKSRPALIWEINAKKERRENTFFPPPDEPDWPVSDDNVVVRAENMFCALYLFTRLALYRFIRFHLLITVIVKLTVLTLLCCIEGNYYMYSVPVICAKVHKILFFFSVGNIWKYISFMCTVEDMISP